MDYAAFFFNILNKKINGGRSDHVSVQVQSVFVVCDINHELEFFNYYIKYATSGEMLFYRLFSTELYQP